MVKIILKLYRHRKTLEFTADDKDGHTQKKQSKRYKNKWSLPQNSESEKKKKVGEEPVRFFSRLLNIVGFSEFGSWLHYASFS